MIIDSLHVVHPCARGSTTSMEITATVRLMVTALSRNWDRLGLTGDAKIPNHAPLTSRDYSAFARGCRTKVPISKPGKGG